MNVSIDKASTRDAREMAEVQLSGLRVAYQGLLPEQLLGHSSIGTRAMHWQTWVQRRRALTYAARLDGNLAGFVAAHTAPREVESEESTEVTALFVAPLYWGKGIATALISRILREFPDDGDRAVVAWVLESNERAKRFYTARSFQPDGGTRIFAQRPEGPTHELRYRLTRTGRRHTVVPD